MGQHCQGCRSTCTQVMSLGGQFDVRWVEVCCMIPYDKPYLSLVGCARDNGPHALDGLCTARKQARSKGTATAGDKC